MKKHVSKALELNITSHSQIQFIDVTLNPDTELFIDPCLIDTHTDKWSLSAKVNIDSYFGKFYEIYKTRQNDAVKLELFKHAHEINATKLGYGNGNNGKAKTPEGMLETFAGVDDLFAKKINVSHPIDLSLLIEGFAEDCLSDLLTNVLFKVLNEFTLTQCQKYGIRSVQKPQQLYYYWDCLTSDWMPYQGNCLIIDGKPILLVPKWFVRPNYYYNTSQYFSMMILGRIQEEKVSFDPMGREIKPSKKSLEKEIIYVNKDKILAAIAYTEKYPYLLDRYHNRIPMAYKDRTMKDETLDSILYGAA